MFRQSPRAALFLRLRFACLFLSFTLLLPWPGAIWFGIACLGAFLSCVLWCFTALAKWLTANELDR
jgi:hypothetical protein